MIYKTLHRKLQIEQHESHQKQEVNAGAPEWLAVLVRVGKWKNQLHLKLKLRAKYT
jgi:hypothetical protein